MNSKTNDPIKTNWDTNADWSRMNNIWSGITTTANIYNNSKREIEIFLTKNKSRLKSYSDVIYMNDKDEFEIEFYNPNFSKVGIEISLNNSKISSSLLVINPMQRVYLSRYIDTDNKFVFNTYTAESDSKEELERLIKQNGKLEFKVFSEKEESYIVNYSGCNTSNQLGYPTFTATNYSSTNDFSMGILNIVDIESSKTLKKETGLIDKGEKSNQNLTSINIEFSYLPYQTHTIQILPVSQKVISEIRSYCTECGYRQRNNNWKHCPKCGTKF